MPQPHHTNRLALLLAAPQPGETAVRRDQAAMTEALLARGLAADQILSLHGPLDRPLVLATLQAAGRRVAGWREGSVFLHVSGHGFFDGDTPETARPALQPVGGYDRRRPFLLRRPLRGAGAAPRCAADPAARPLTRQPAGGPCARPRQRDHPAGCAGRGAGLPRP